jgi:hypothetical protein
MPAKKAATPAPSATPAATTPPAKKAAVKKTAAKKTVAAKPAAAAKADSSPRLPTRDEITQAAYLVFLKRKELGLPGDSATDWLEAERQLLSQS